VTKLTVAFRNFENASKKTSQLRRKQSLKALVCGGRLKKTEFLIFTQDDQTPALEELNAFLHFGNLGATNNELVLPLCLSASTETFFLTQNCTGTYRRFMTFL
jgi:hypothetical protein